MWIYKINDRIFQNWNTVSIGWFFIFAVFFQRFSLFNFNFTLIFQASRQSNHISNIFQRKIHSFGIPSSHHTKFYCLRCMQTFSDPSVNKIFRRFNVPFKCLPIEFTILLLIFLKCEICVQHYQIFWIYILNKRKSESGNR